MAAMTFFMRNAAERQFDPRLSAEDTLGKGRPSRGPALVTTDPNYTFASTITPGNEKLAYPTGGGGGRRPTSPRLRLVETTATLLAPYDPAQIYSPY